jgi:hypothetical protein
MTLPENTLAIHNPLARALGETLSLITNPHDAVETADASVSPSSSLITPAIAEIRQYLMSILFGDEGRAHCPFVKAVENENGYHISASLSAPSFILRSGGLQHDVERMMSAFQQLSPFETHDDQAVDPTVLVRVYTHPDAVNRGFFRKMNGVQHYYRPQFLARGLMFSQMHSFHPPVLDAQRGQRQGLNSPMPIFVTRRMHKHDYVSMRNDDERNVFRRFFPDYKPAA